MLGFILYVIPIIIVYFFYRSIIKCINENTEELKKTNATLEKIISKNNQVL